MWIVLDGTIHIRYFYTIDNKLITNQTSDKLFYGCNVVPIEIFVYSVRYFFSYLRIYEVSCSDLYANLFTGGMNFHGKFEYCSLTTMHKTEQVILNLAQLWAE